MLDLLDALEDRHKKDIEALTHIATSVLYKPGFLQSFVSTQTGQEGKPFLVTRGTLVALLFTSQFAKWQQCDWIELQTVDGMSDAPDGALILNSENGFNFQEILSNQKWQRIVDLGLEKSGFSTWVGPRSTKQLDGQILKLDVALVVDFMRSARYMSWDEKEWLAPASLEALQRLLCDPLN